MDRKIELHYNIFRYFDRDIDRFIQPNLIGFLVGIKFYQFALNVSTWIDPWRSYSLINFVNWKDLNSRKNHQQEKKDYKHILRNTDTSLVILLKMNI
ncbi:hypothetical protein [Gilliamella apicola]|uniref:hypothetical protein n=1 Tax=Gilliamella apicola TaxID=1196095 RepID=UPI00080DB1E3|nr:hypothetical protein [Gilliamella apicola]OCG14222.1 hypothetical protein A9G14_01555 [Gilliamella apicola]ORF44831.1 hypothetical protein B5800_10165 [Gilliamella apicola]ORF45816.1 hypothetical protein B5803_13155 [Gilliamella apicola]ORF48051.1 hypothetical protein B5799_10125 [Gilliamella apicola]ORF52224.1 hypothetical protein B5802_10220 [Gilliamella apicola]